MFKQRGRGLPVRWRWVAVICSLALVVVVGVRGLLPTAAVQQAPSPGDVLGSYGAPVQTGIAGPDSPSSFSATLPNGRRVTPVGRSVTVGENPLNTVLTPDGKFMITTNDDERNNGAVSTKVSQDATNGAGKVPGGFTLAVVRAADMQVISYTLALKNPKPNPGPKVPGLSQSDNTAALFLGVAVKANAAVPGGYTVYAAGGPSDVVSAYTLSPTGTLALVGSIPIPVPTDPTKPNYGMAAPGGLTLSPDGSRLYVVNNNANTVVTIDTATNQIVGAPVAVGFFPYAAVLAPAANKLYVSNWGVADRSFNASYTSSYSPTTGTGTGTPFLSFDNPRTDAARTSSISVLSLGGGAPAGSISLARPIDGVNIVGGTHPSALATVGGVLYVTDANEDALALIDTASDTLVKKVSLPPPSPALTSTVVYGLSPNALATTPDNSRLFVAEAGLNAVAVYNVRDPLNPAFEGRIPTGWYPTGVTVSADGRTLYVTNAKGAGNAFQFQGAVPGSPDVNLLFGTVQQVDLASLNLAATTAQVTANTFQLMPSESAQVLRDLRSKVDHVFYILRENKTYDTYFGADATLNARGANGKPEYAVYNAQVPNTKALAEQFAIGDNVYADAEESDAGHSFALAGTSTDYQQKTLLSRFARPFINIKNEDPEDYPLLGYIFNNLARQHQDYRDYGDMIRVSGYDDGSSPARCPDDPYPGCTTATYAYSNTTAPTVGYGGLYAEDVPALRVLGDYDVRAGAPTGAPADADDAPRSAAANVAQQARVLLPLVAKPGNPHTDPNYPGWNLRISDQRRAKEFIRDMGARIQAGTVPRFTFIWLPDDHTGSGIDPRFSVSDNDAALGQIVDFISHSSVWGSSAIFITEDDAQGSPDHVYAHRTSTMVVSPYARRATVVHRLSSTVSIPKTIEELLGLPAMAHGDLLANDLADYFTTTPDLTPYTAIAQAAPAAAAPEAQRIAQLSDKLDNTTYDQDTRRLGEINTLFFQSLALAERRAQMEDEAYDAAQDALYEEGLRVVNSAPAPDTDG